MDPFLGMIAIFGFNFTPRNWMSCEGQLLPIQTNTALYSLLGATFGGDGRTTFAVPNLKGKIPIGYGQGPNLSYYDMGYNAGWESVYLTSLNLPIHSHTITGTTEAGDTASPEGAFPAGTGVFDKDYRSTSSTPTIMNTQMIGLQGASAPLSVVNPVLGLNICIATSGIYPPRS